MTLYMLDTDTCAFVMRGPTKALRRKLLATPLEQQSISVVTLTERLYGARVSAPTTMARCCAISCATWLCATGMSPPLITMPRSRSHLKSKGQMIGANDLMVAAHARSRSAVIVTNSVRKFARVPGPKVESWA